MDRNENINSMEGKSLKDYLSLFKKAIQNDSSKEEFDNLSRIRKNLIDTGNIDIETIGLEELLMDRCDSLTWYEGVKDFIDALNYYNDNVEKIEPSTSKHAVFELLKSDHYCLDKASFFISIYDNRFEQNHTYQQMTDHIIYGLMSLNKQEMNKWSGFYDHMVTTNGIS